MITGNEQFWKTFRETNGALSACESIAIMNIAASSPQGLRCELGSYKGKSAMSALYHPCDDKFLLVDPEFKDPEWIKQTARSIGEATGRNNHLEFIPDYSTNVLPRHEEYAYIFVDSGSHQDGLPMQEMKLLEDRVVKGGIVCFHDLFSQFKEVEEAYVYLISTGKYEKIDIDWREIVEYVGTNGLESGNNSWHHTELAFPCFVGAVRRK